MKYHILLSINYRFNKYLSQFFYNIARLLCFFNICYFFVTTGITLYCIL